MAYKRSIYFSDEFSKYLTIYVSRMQNGRTAEEVWGAVRVLCDYLKKDFLELDGCDVESFFNYMAVRVSQGSLRCTTYNNRKSIYGKLALFLHTEYPELGFDNPFVLIRPLSYKAGIKASKIPSLEEVDAVLEASKKEPMYYLILSLAFRVALAASQIIHLRRDNVYRDGENLSLYIPGNGYKDDLLLPLSADIGVLLVEYISNMDYTDAEGRLFYNKYKNPLSLKNLDTAVARFVSASGIANRYTLQDLRSRAILDMVRASTEAGEDAMEVATYVGIKELRLNTYISAAMLAEKCPADLVNLRVKPLSSIAEDCEDEGVAEW